VAGEPISGDFDFNKLQYMFRFRNYVQAPVPVVHVTSPEQLDQVKAPSSMSLLSNDGTQGDTTHIWFGHPPEGITAPFETEIFVPSYHYDEAGLEILVSDGDWRYVKERQTLYYRHRDMRPGAVHSIMIKPVIGPLSKRAAAAAASEDVAVDGTDIQVPSSSSVESPSASTSAMTSASTSASTVPVQRQKSRENVAGGNPEDGPDRAQCIMM
jgi:hypothetical protein